MGQTIKINVKIFRVTVRIEVEYRKVHFHPLIENPADRCGQQKGY